QAVSGTDPAHCSPVARVVASQNSPAPSARARRITACDSRESSKSNLQENRAPTAKNRQIDYLSEPNHPTHSMAFKFFTDDEKRDALWQASAAGPVALGGSGRRFL